MRLFIAIDLSSEVKANVATLCKGIKAARWVKPEQMHLTLCFIGEAKTSEPLQAALASVSASPFELRFTGVDTFPGKRGHAGVLWLGLQPCAALMHLQKQIEQAAQTAGFPPENKEYRPHLTLARFSRNPGIELQTWLTANQQAQATIHVQAFQLFESKQTSTGPEYQVIAAYPLK